MVKKDRSRAKPQAAQSIEAATQEKTAGARPCAPAAPQVGQHKLNEARHGVDGILPWVGPPLGNTFGIDWSVSAT
jgi:hypothetical protein